MKGKSKVRQEPFGFRAGFSEAVQFVGGGGGLEKNKETKTCLTFVTRTHWESLLADYQEPLDILLAVDTWLSALI